MIISDTSKEFKIAPAGNHLARLYSCIDLGHQSVIWNGDTKIMHKVVLTWELHGEDENGEKLETEDKKPLIVSKRYTVSLGDQSTLRKDLESWSGKKMTTEDRKNFDLKNLLGKFCMLSVVHSEDGKYANVSGISAVPTALRNNLPDGINAPVHFWLQDFDQAKYEALPKYYREKIAESSEWRGKQKRDETPPIQDDSGFGPADSDIPF
jgi:hypothetical protein